MTAWMNDTTSPLSPAAPLAWWARAVGAGLSFVADRLLEEGCTNAFTLDGGQTAAMVFMGKTVMDPGTYNGYTKTRAQPDVIGIGVTEQKVPKN